MLEIIFQDDHLVAINKPHGLLVHRSPIAADADEFAVQLLRDQLGQKVFPVHRLDRKTGGVLLFALDSELNKQMQIAFMERRVYKKYLAFVRGFAPESGTIDYPLFDDEGRSHEAITHFIRIEQFEVPVAHGKHQTSRYSIVEVKPETGRMHQIRRHFAHIFHPIIGDRPHGCNKQNKLFLETWKMNTMLLHASELRFTHPVIGKEIVIKAGLQSEFNRMLDLIRTDNILTL
jgi:tRNA pseudouridine65 synthase